MAIWAILLVRHRRMQSVTGRDRCVSCEGQLGKFVLIIYWCIGGLWLYVIWIGMWCAGFYVWCVVLGKRAGN